MAGTDPFYELESFRRLNDLCSRFEREWQQGGRPVIDDFLRDAEDDERDSVLRELLLQEWAGRRQRRETFDREEYLTRFASQRDAVVAAWQQWQRWLYPSDAGGGASTPPTQHPSRPAIPLPAVKLVGYEQVEPLGRGGMGIVYRAFDPRLKRLVALKMIHAGMLSEQGIGRFRREAEVLARLTHPHVVGVYAWEEVEGQPLLAMEYVPGGNLEDRLADGPLSPRESARLVAVLARAVQAAHQAGVIHRDLKPANVLMAAEVPGDSGNAAGGYPKVSDFGLAGLVVTKSGYTGSGMVLGTPHYMSPEQAEGKVKEVGPAADVWALGVILYRCLAGKLPFTGEGALAVLDKVRREAPERLTGVPSALEAICLSCLEKQAPRRPTPAALAEGLERWLADPSDQVLPSTVAMDPGGEAAPPGRRMRWSWRVASVAFVLLAGGALAALAIEGWGPLRVASIEIKHRDREGHARVMGKDATAADFDDQVKLFVTLTRRAYAYVLEFDAAGKVNLKWPRGRDGKPDEAMPPPRTAKLVCPPDANWMNLDDNPEGGMHTFAVLVSMQPLPAYEAWRRDLPWERLEPGKVVWGADAEGPFVRFDGGLRVRSSEGPSKDAEPLVKLWKALRRAPEIEAVEMIAFPVRAKKGE